MLRILFIPVYTFLFTLVSVQLLATGANDKKFKAIGPTEVTCAGSVINLTTSGNGSFEYSWYPSNYFQNSHQQSVSATILKTTEFTVVRSKNGSTIEDTAHITVRVENEKVNLAGNQKICEGGTTFLELDKKFTSPTWNTGEKTHGITVTKPGKYSVEAIGNCKSISGEIFVTQINKPLARIVTYNDLDICEGEEVELSVFGSPAEYEWSNGATSRKITVNESAQISLMVKNQCGVSTDNKIVTLHEIDASFIPNKLTGTVPFKLNLANDSYISGTDKWLVNGEFLSDERDASINIVDDGTYEVELIRKDVYGCSNKMKYSSIIALPAPPKSIDEDKLVVFPNSFSPNGDGLNDEFIFESAFINEVQFSIFDRWGREIFESRNSESWDGTFANGIEAKSGQYILKYSFQDLDGQIIDRTVTLNLIR